MKIETQEGSTRAHPAAAAQADHGDAERPRLAVFRSVSHIYAQVIDDMSGHDARVGVEHRAGAEGVSGKARRRQHRPGPRRSARSIAERLKDKGITRVVFDRGGYLYHGRVKAVAEAAREAGLEF